MSISVRPQPEREPTEPFRGAPRIVLSLGLYRSASTWAFNVTATILRLGGPARTIMAEDPDALAARIGGDALVLVKSHAPTAGLLLLARIGDVPLVVTVREPLDCVASLMERFGEDFSRAVADVAASADAILAALDAALPLILRYEDDGRDADTVRRIAGHLAVPLGPGDAERIAACHTSAQIRALTKALAEIEPAGDRPLRDRFDPETHWHPGHLGEGRSGRHAEILTPAQVAIVRRHLRPFRLRFGYSTPPPPPIASGSRLDFAGTGLPYCTDGFGAPEAWGIWTDGALARLDVPLTGPAARLRLQLLCDLAPVFCTTSCARAVIGLAGVPIAEIVASDSHPRRLVLAIHVDAGGIDALSLEIRLEHLVPVDPRLLGLGLVSLVVDFEPACGVPAR